LGEYKGLEVEKTEVSISDEQVEAEINRTELLKAIYYQSVDALTMQEVEAWSDSERIQGCIAVQAGEIRLIDNIRIR
jgi:pantoate--beta-alanine ligase